MGNGRRGVGLRQLYSDPMLWPLGLAILTGALLRSYRLGSNSLWVDEFATLALATHSPGEILGLSSSANFIPPLYFLLIHGVISLLGDSEVSLRILSVIAGICTIPVVWMLAEEVVHDRSAAHVAAALLALNPLHLWYSQEARPYALLLFWGCCALLGFARAARTKSLWDWASFSAFATLAILTHTTGIIFLVVAWLWGLLSADRLRLLRPLAVSSTALGFACLPFFIAIGRALKEAHGTFHSPPRAITGLELGYTLLTYLTGYSFGPAPREIQNLGPWAALSAHSSQSIIAGAMLLGLLLISVFKWRATMTWFATALAFTLGSIFALAVLSGKAYNVRYTLPGLVGFLGLVSITVRALRSRSRALWLTGLFGLALWADAQWYWVPRYWKEDSRAAVSWLRDMLPPGATVAVAPSYHVRPLEYYAARAATELHFRGIVPDSGFPNGPLPDAVVLTRLHHVPNWQELRAEFQRLAGAGALHGRVSGYEILVRRQSRPGGRDTTPTPSSLKSKN